MWAGCSCKVWLLTFNLEHFGVVLVSIYSQGNTLDCVKHFKWNSTGWWWKKPSASLILHMLKSFLVGKCAVFSPVYDMHPCVHVCVWAWVNMLTCVDACEDQSLLSVVLFNHFSILCFSLNLEFITFFILSGQWPLGVCCALPLSTSTTDAHNPSRPFHRSSCSHTLLPGLSPPIPELNTSHFHASHSSCVEG